MLATHSLAQESRATLQTSLKMLGHLYSREVSNLQLPVLLPAVTTLYSCHYTVLL